MLRGMSASQFQEWRAYADLEPFDEERADLRAASIVQAIYNVNRRKGSRPIALKDCALVFGPNTEPAKPKTVEQQRAEIRATLDILMAIHKPPSKRKRLRRN